MAREARQPAMSFRRTLLALLFLAFAFAVAPRAALADVADGRFANIDSDAAVAQTAEATPFEDAVNHDVPIPQLPDPAILADGEADVSALATDQQDSDNYAAIAASVYYDEAFEVLRLMNQERANAGLSPLRMDADLMETATGRSMECAIVFSHTRPNGTSCFTVYPNGSGTYGENIAAGEYSATEVMNDWMHSPGHRSNILNSSFRTVGVGCIVHNGIPYWTQAFSGKSASSDCAQPSNEAWVISTPLTTGPIRDDSGEVYRLNPRLDTPSSFTVGLGESDTPISFSQVNPAFPYASATLFGIAWTSSNPSVATVDLGFVTGVKAGNATLNCDLSGFPFTVNVRVVDGVPVYRLYNPYTYEHLFTIDSNEREADVDSGWSDEGVEWYAPRNSSTPVYRLYNPFNGDHFYTTSLTEYNQLVRARWQGEGTKFYGADSSGVPVYRLYNPFNHAAGAHHYTTSASERDDLVRVGWKNENVGWYGVR